jgi:hypothetical protein
VLPVQWLIQTSRLQLFPRRAVLLNAAPVAPATARCQVKLTDAMAPILGISDWRKRQIIGELERGGWVRVEGPAPWSSGRSSSAAEFRSRTSELPAGISEYSVVGVTSRMSDANLLFFSLRRSRQNISG